MEDKLKSEDCIILSLDTVEQIKTLTGMKTEEIAELYRQSLYTGIKQVYWQRGDRWFNVAINERYISPFGEIGENVMDMLDKHSRMKLPT